MKQKIRTLISASAALALSASLTQAGEPVMVEPAPAPTPSLWQWFIGASGGYLFDSENEFWSGHVGAEKFNGSHSHALFLEVGWTEFDEQAIWKSVIPPNGLPGGNQRLTYGVDIDIVPITLNYKFEGRFGDGCWGYYVGAGAGVALTDTQIGLYSSDSTLFYGQVFGGLVWNISESFEIFSGVRWIYMEDLNDPLFDVGGLDDGMVELGGRFNF